MPLQHNAAQYDSRLPAWALPPPLMCLHFHPMAVSRWFSAASLKQVSNMAITGSGSLAVSLYVFVISAVFLPKGKFFFCFGCVVRLWCRITPHTSESPRSAGEKLWCVCALDAHKLPLKSQHHFLLLWHCCRLRNPRAVSPLCSMHFSGDLTLSEWVLSRVWLQKRYRGLVIKK